MPRPSTILIVEDDEAIATGLFLNLRLEGFKPTVARDGETALAELARLAPDLILLDISLPTMSGLDVLADARRSGNKTPIIVLSARQDEYDKVAALRLGADDYVTKPFGVAELLARIHAVLRRSGGTPGEVAPGSPARVHVFADSRVDLETRDVTRAGKPIPLTHLEFELLSFFVHNPDKVFSRQELLRHVWGIEHSGSARTVDNFVAQLRGKLEEDPNRPRHFVTVRGSGYRFAP